MRSRRVWMVLSATSTWAMEAKAKGLRDDQGLGLASATGQSVLRAIEAIALRRSVRDLLDLVAYLESLKGGEMPGAPGGMPPGHTMPGMQMDHNHGAGGK